MSSSSQPYLPMTFSELKSLLEMDNIVEWPTYRFRLLGEFQVSQEDIFGVQQETLRRLPNEY